MRRPEPLPRDLLAVARPQEWLVDVRQVRDAGMSRGRLDRAVAAGRIVRVDRGVYDLLTTLPAARTADPDVSRGDVHEHRRRRAAWHGLLAHGPQAIAVGQTALVLLGVQGLPLEPKVEVVRPDRRARDARDGVVLRRYATRPRTVLVDGRRVVPVVTALAQAVPELDRRHAIAVMDSALHQRLLDRSGLRRAHDAARGRRGVGRTHDWWELADARAESPIETWARLSCLDEGIRPDRLQHEFCDAAGRVVARADMAWWLGDRWLVAELDGLGFHSGEVALVKDSRRQNRLVSAGHPVHRFSARDAWAGVPGRDLAQVLAAARWAPGRTVPPSPTYLPDRRLGKLPESTSLRGFP